MASSLARTGRYGVCRPARASTWLDVAHSDCDEILGVRDHVVYMTPFAARFLAGVMRDTALGLDLALAVRSEENQSRESSLAA